MFTLLPVSERGIAGRVSTMELSSCERSVREARTEASPGANDLAKQTGWMLTTVLTTTGPDKLPCSPMLQSAYGQVSHGMPQSACSLQAGGQGFKSP